jgi:hypothetical protein
VLIDTESKDGTNPERQVPPGDWLVPVCVSALDLEAKWDRLSPLSAVLTEEMDSPHATVARGEDLPSILTRREHTPEIVIIDGGAIHSTTTLVLRKRGM